MKPYQKLAQRWAADGARIRTVTGQPWVTEIESRYDLRMPEDFRDYLVHLCPISLEYDDNDDAVFSSWWPLERIKSIPDEYEFDLKNEAVRDESKRYLFFADYMVWAMAWAINCSEDENRGRIVVFSDGERFIADSFSDFVDQYLRDVGQLL